MSQIIPKVSATDLAAVADLADENIITEDELSLVGSGSQGGFAFASGDYLEGPSDDFGTSDFTLVFDVLWDDAPTGTEYFSRKSSGNNRWNFYATATQYILLTVDNVGGTNTYTWTITPSVNHRNIILSADRSGNATLYLNGASQGTQDISGDSAVDFGSSNTNEQRLGMDNSSTFDGKMFQVRYYLEAKTSAQVLNIAKGHNDTDNLFLKLAPTSTNESGWTDVSGNNRNFTANGATRIESNISKKYVSENEVPQNLIGLKSRFYFDGNDRIDNIGEEALNTNDWTWLAETNPLDESGFYGILYGLGSGGFNNRRYLRYNNGAYDVTIGDSSATVIEVDWPAEPAVVVVTHESSTSTIKIFINGEFIKSATHSNQFDVGSSPIATNGVDVGALGGGSFFKGEISRVQTFNRVLSDSEIIDISKGQRLGFADVGADGTVRYSSDFTSDSVDGWAVGTGDGTLDATQTIGSDSDNIEFTISSGAASKGIYKSGLVPATGKRVRVEMEVYIPSTNSHIDGITFITGDGGISSNNQFTFVTQDAWTKLEKEVIVDGTNTNLIILMLDGTSTTINDTGNDTVAFRNIKTTDLGQVLALLPESAATGKWYNEGGAGSSGDGTVTGATLINERKRGVFDNLYLDNVPSSSAGLATGEVYRDNNGHLKIVI